MEDFDYLCKYCYTSLTTGNHARCDPEVHRELQRKTTNTIWMSVLHLKSCDDGNEGCNNPSINAHICPFEAELEDDLTVCSCCEDCTQECSASI